MSRPGVRQVCVFHILILQFSVGQTKRMSSTNPATSDSDNEWNKAEFKRSKKFGLFYGVSWN